MWRNEVAHVPLILSYPERLPPGRTSELTQSVDVHPTLLALLDVPVPTGKAVDGLALPAELEGAGREWVFSIDGARSSEHSLLLNLREDGLERIARGEPPRLAGLRFYDLAADPHEDHNLARAAPLELRGLLKIYVERMQPKLQRYLHATPPTGELGVDGEFGILPHDLATRPEVARRQLGLGPDLTGVERGAGWIHNASWTGSFLQAESGAGPLEISVRIPSGEYRVTFAVSGTASLQAPGGDETLEAAGPPVSRRTPPTPNTDALRVTVVDDVFRLRITPRTESGPFRLAALGFAPTTAVAWGDEAEELERAEALRALGYTQ